MTAPSPVPTSAPSAEGVDAAGLVALLDAVEADPVIEPHGLIVQRHGRRILETYWGPHRAGELRLVYSLSKSFTGAALGVAVGDGLVSLDDRVVEHLPESADGVDERTARMRIRHLASMATGHHDETLLAAILADPEDLVGSFLHLPPEHEPGTWFAYNQPPVLTLSAILHRLTGQRLVDQLQDRVLDPIGVRDLRWVQYRDGIDVGFSGVYTDLDAIARLGQLHLDDGRHGDRQILPAGWVAEASAVQVTNEHRPEPDWSLGYGIQLWRCRHGYRGDGAFGQYMVVLPDQDAVVAFFSHSEPMQPFLDHLWTHLVPAMDTAGGEPDPVADQELSERCRGLQLPTAAQRTGGTATGAATATGVRMGRYERGPGPGHTSITGLRVEPTALVVEEGDEELRVQLSGDWSDVEGHQMSASAAVDADGSLRVDLVVRASPHRLVIRTDPRAATFSATWPLVPLFGLGLDGRLSHMRPPPR